MTTCNDDNCTGTVLADGYCDTCGLAAASVPSAAAASTGQPTPSPLPERAPAPVHHVDMALVGNVCAEPDCAGTILADGYCNTCGIAAQLPAPPPPPPPPSGSLPTTDPRARGGSEGGPESVVAAPRSTSSARFGTSSSTKTRRVAAAQRRTDALGAGLVDVAPTPEGDPADALMSNEAIAAVIEETPEEERFCRNCEEPVGRSRGDQPGRTEGFCGSCRTPFDFVSNQPALSAGDLVAGQYHILGPIAHGGMGWIYLGQDTAVSNRWVVLKGILNRDDPDAVAAAVAEREFLAQIEHPNIVNIYNFVTWGGAGYIVMEYVGGESLNQKLKQRRRDNGGVPNPLGLQPAIAYVLGVLPALGYLHRQGLVYNDLKPANIMATEAGVKLIDVGGVMKIDDDDAAIFGTQGFQAPEVAAVGPSVASDLYTVGRTLAVLTLNFAFHTGTYQYALPDRSEEPLFARWESWYRFMLKATAENPEDRFQSAEAMGQQLTGVLREIVARSTGTPRPTISQLFGPDRLAELLAEDASVALAPSWPGLPLPRVAEGDPAAGFLGDLPEDPTAALQRLAQAVDDGHVQLTPEVALANARLLVTLGEDPAPALRMVAEADPWDWRIGWMVGLYDLQRGEALKAAESFSQVWTQLPGEIAPKLAVALAAESGQQTARAAQLYESIVETDPTYVAASFGLARCRHANGDRLGAIGAYGSVPVSSAGYFDAQLAQARTLSAPLHDGTTPSVDDLLQAATTIERLQLDNVERSRESVIILEQALEGVHGGDFDERPQVTLFGEGFTEEGLRSALERTYRELARVAPTARERYELVDQANKVRVVTLT